MRSRKLVLALSVLLMLALLCGCSSGGQSSSGAGSGETVVLEFFYQKNDTPQIMAIVDAFNASQDRIKVELNMVSSDTGKQIFQTRLATDDPMDLLQHWATQVEFRLAGAEGRLVDLSNESWISNVMSKYAELSSVDGKLYSLPLALNNPAMVYNIDMFEENGWNVPTTWDELIALCESIQAAGMEPITFSNKDKDSVSQKFYLLSIACANDEWDPEEFYLGIVNGSGADVRDNDYTRQIAERLIQINEYAQTDSLGCSYDQANINFANGQTPMLFNGTWVAASIDQANPDINYAWFPVPGPEGLNKIPYSIDCSIAAMVGTGHEEEAKEFIAFASQAANAQLYADIDGQPSPIDGVVVENPRVELLVPFMETESVIKMYGDFFPAGARNDVDNACQTLIIDKDLDKFLDEWQRILTSS